MEIWCHLRSILLHYSCKLCVIVFPDVNNAGLQLRLPGS
jgi:hypothetical protein